MPSYRTVFDVNPVTVSYAQEHGGPATTAAGTTSVGTAAVRRFQRPVAYQDLPDAALPTALQEANPWRLVRRVDGRFVGAGTQAGWELSRCIPSREEAECWKWNRTGRCVRRG